MMSWRIRQKLLAGLTLVVCCLGVLFAGTLWGLCSYRGTMKSMDSKLTELRSAQEVQDAIAQLAALAESEHGVTYTELARRIAQVRTLLQEYRAQLEQSVRRGRDPDDGQDERDVAGAVEEILHQLEERSLKSLPATMSATGGEVSPLEPGTIQILRRLRQLAPELREVIHTDLSRRIQSARQDYRVSLIAVSLATTLAVLLLLALSWLAYRWIMAPIRELHEKVMQLAQGNFDSHIAVQSQDEMRDLAEAFNHMIDRLQEIYRDLARQVNERSRQLVRSERLAGLGFLAAGVAHEINNPLASIAFCSEALEHRIAELFADKPEAPDLASIRQYLAMIQQEAFRCKKITEKLLEFSRVGEKHRELTDLAQLTQSVLEIVKHMPHHKGKVLRLEVRQRPRVLANAHEIKSVILNLVVNGLESMDPGGELTITLDIQDDWAVMTFRDTGCGMTPEVLEHIFEPFYTRSRTGKGTGLGLSISHHIISQHGGEIEAHSDGPNRGSTFIVRLPLRASKPVPEVSVSGKAA
ncbi:MAG: HAMP domain-containing sensor histidine kinase [Gemmatales bacterium]|nr:HAMP domain-containing histidine kinase [Gemmatales bacterium]MDW8176504.1 HAMP domain-containing sensor histidine kinase [Gemmatales bacterium]